MESFVTFAGEVPPAARRLADFEAHQHGAPWVRRVLGKGICSFVIGYTLADRWWTYCFERLTPPAVSAPDRLAPPSNEVEVWSIEAYDSSGSSWTETYRYDSVDDHWHENDESLPVPIMCDRSQRVI